MEVKKTATEIMKNLNGTSKIPQKTTFGGLGIIFYQLSNLLVDVQVGSFLISLKSMTYGTIIAGYSPIVFGIILLLFNEEKFMKLYKGEK